jgi:hypothetical protein
LRPPQHCQARFASKVDERIQDAVSEAERMLARDGSIWEIRRGEDYDVDTENMRVNLHMRAEAQVPSRKVRTTKFHDGRGEGLVFQFFDAPEHEDAMPTSTAPPSTTSSSRASTTSAAASPSGSPRLLGRRPRLIMSFRPEPELPPGTLRRADGSAPEPCSMSR